MRGFGGEFGFLLLLGFQPLVRVNGGLDREKQRKRKNVDLSGRIMRVSKLKPGNKERWQGRKAQLKNAWICIFERQE